MNFSGQEELPESMTAKATVESAGFVPASLVDQNRKAGEILAGKKELLIESKEAIEKNFSELVQLIADQEEKLNAERSNGGLTKAGITYDRSAALGTGYEAIFEAVRKAKQNIDLTILEDINHDIGVEEKREKNDSKETGAGI